MAFGGRKSEVFLFLFPIIAPGRFTFSRMSEYPLCDFMSMRAAPLGPMGVRREDVRSGDREVRTDLT